MSYFLQGLGYGVMALGWLLSFSGGVIVLVSFCCCMNWIGERITGAAAEIENEEDVEDEYDPEN